MAHKRRTGKLRWKNKRANHGAKPGKGKEKSTFRRDYRRSQKSSS